MRDIQTLRQRMAQADRHFRAAEEARSQESVSLSETWESLKQRFVDQQRELTRYRARIDVLVEANDELAGMIDRLLETLEASAKRVSDETVPRVVRLARDLLDNEKAFDGRQRPIPDPPPLPPGLKAEGEAEDAAEDAADDDDTGDDLARDRVVTEDRDPRIIAERGETRNIGSLIERIGGMVERNAAARIARAADAEPAGPEAPPPPSPRTELQTEPEPEDRLSRELRDIESLRDQLSGLRGRITGRDAGRDGGREHGPGLGAA